MADNVRIEYSVGGVQDAKREVEGFNRSVQELKPASESANTATGDLGAGLGLVATSLSTVSPAAANWLVTLEGVRFLSEGAAAGTRNLAAAGAGILKFVSNPFVLGAAVIFAGIASAVSEWKREQDELNKRLETTRTRLEEQKQALDEIEGRDRQDLESLIPDIERDVVRAGLPVGSAAQVATESARAAAISGLPVSQVTEIARQVVAETRQVPDAQRLADIAGAVELTGGRGDFDSLRELIDSIPAIRGEIRRAAEERRAGLGGEIAERGAERQIDVVRSGTGEGQTDAELRAELFRTQQRLAGGDGRPGLRERLATDDVQRPGITDRLVGGLFGALTLGLADNTVEADRAADRSRGIIEQRIAAESERANSIQAELDRRQALRGDVQTGASDPGPVVRNPRSTDFGSGITINNNGGTINLNSDNPVNRSGGSFIDRTSR